MAAAERQVAKPKGCSLRIRPGRGYQDGCADLVFALRNDLRAAMQFGNNNIHLTGIAVGVCAAQPLGRRNRCEGGTGSLGGWGLALAYGDFAWPLTHSLIRFGMRCTPPTGNLHW